MAIQGAAHEWPIDLTLPYSLVLQQPAGKMLLKTIFKNEKMLLKHKPQYSAELRVVLSNCFQSQQVCNLVV